VLRPSDRARASLLRPVVLCEGEDSASRVGRHAGLLVRSLQLFQHGNSRNAPGRDRFNAPDPYSSGRTSPRVRYLIWRSDDTVRGLLGHTGGRGLDVVGVRAYQL